MAKWLDKYEQGGLVLKKKTKDNYDLKANPNDVKVSTGPGFVGLGYGASNWKSPAWGGQFQNGGFLQPNDWRLPSGVAIPNKADILSSELATSIGGEDGEPAYLIPSFKGGKRVNALKEYQKTGEHLGGPFKTWQEADKWEQEIRHPYVEKGQPIPTPLKTWGDMAVGGSIPGAVGFTYARTINPAPANGKYTKKTLASAQNGQEMKFYQDGLDFKPKSISKNGSVIKDDMGQWAHPGEITEIGSPDITMKGVDYPVLGISDTGDTKLMQPGEDYKFKGKKVTEYPMMQEGGWLDKYPEPMRQDATRNVIPRKMTDKEKLEAVATSDQAQKRALNNAKEVIAERKKNKATKGDLNTPGSWHTEDKARLFPSSVGGAGEMFDEYINPATYTGVLADALGESVAARDPKAIATSLALAAVTGALGIDPLGSALKVPGKVAQSMESGLLSNAYKLNPYAFKADPTKYYRQAGKAAYDDAVIEGKMYAKGQKELLEKNPNINYTDEYNASIAADEAGKFHLTKPANAPFVQKGKLFYPIDRKPTGAGYKGTKFADAEYLFEGALPDEAVLPRYQEKYLSSLNQSGGAGVVKPEFNDLDNFKTYQKNWLKGYKEVPKPTSTQRVTRGPINYWEEPGFAKRNPNFNPEAYANSPVGNPNALRDIPKGMEPRLSKDESGGWLNKYK